ncbi:hypothetical protein Scep_011895 [Stephania cephalantha]|uniref:Xyloglucan endotransglucosylase/hydrolase n=1 Tax=Stephania cephalantha TaxID=152367 RepID=A0AAP0P607_9MAGN
MLFFLLFVTSLMASTTFAGNFYNDFDITWGGPRAKILNGGQLLTLSLRRGLGSAFDPKMSISLEGLICKFKSRRSDSLASLSPPTIFLVDNIPIREFNNAEKLGVPYPKSQPMRIYSSLWNADDWATRGGLVKTDWTKAPFTAYYRNFNANACTSATSCSSTTKNGLRDDTWRTQELDAWSRRRLRWVQKNYMIYNYCSDLKRFAQGVPPECRPSRVH